MRAVRVHDWPGPAGKEADDYAVMLLGGMSKSSILEWAQLLGAEQGMREGMPLLAASARALKMSRPVLVRVLRSAGPGGLGPHWHELLSASERVELGEVSSSWTQHPEAQQQPRDAAAASVALIQPQQPRPPANVSLHHTCASPLRSRLGRPCALGSSFPHPPSPVALSL